MFQQHVIVPSHSPLFSIILSLFLARVRFLPPSPPASMYNIPDILNLLNLDEPTDRYRTTEEKPFTRLFPRDLSLECTEGDQESELIEFTYDGRIWMSMTNIPEGKFISSPIPLYHSHVLWSYVLCQYRQLDGSYELSLRDCGPHLKSVVPVKKTVKNLVSDVFPVGNHPDGLTHPDLITATGTFVDANGVEKETIEFAKDAAGHYTAPKRFTREQLAARADSDGETIRILLRFVVARSYFTLSKLLKEPPTVSEEKAVMVEQILRGEKTPGWDLAITTGTHDGDSGDTVFPRTYYVHSAAFTSISDNFKNGCLNGRSFGLVMHDKNSCTITDFAPDDMPALISLVYGVDAQLPTNLERVGATGKAITGLLGWEFMQRVLLPKWEWAICKEALALDKREQSSLEVLLRLMLTVFAAPYGFLPVAKRVVIGIHADVAWLSPNNDPLVYIADIAMETLGALFHASNYIEAKIFRSTITHLEFIPAVRKVGLSMKKKKHDVVKEEEVNDDVAVISPTPSHPLEKPDRDAPTVVAIEDVDVEEEPAIDSAKWQCTIS